MLLFACDGCIVQSSSQAAVSSTQTPETVVSKERSNKVPQKTTLSLFDDEDDDADLFEVSSSDKSKTTKSSADDTSKVLSLLYCDVCTAE